MNVLLVIEGTYPWYRGGVSEWTYQYIKNCSEFSFSILQIATDSFISLEPEKALYPIPQNIISFDRIPPPEFKADWNSSLFNWYENHISVLELATNFDLVHVTNTGFAGWIGNKISESIDLPLVVTEHAIYWLEVEKGAIALECGYKIPDSLEGKSEIVSLFKKIALQVYKSADQLISVSKCNIPLQKELGATEVVYVPNGIPENWINPKKLYSSKPVFGWVGRCAEMKNPLQFFKFIEEFKKLGFDCEFLMLLSDAGEKELEFKVREEAEKYENLTTVWDKPSETYYKKMDMLFITSHNESQPLVMLEALSKKVLPVGRRVGDLDNQYGLTFNSDISDFELCREVIQFWENEEARIAYINERFENLKYDHKWENLFSLYESLIEETVNQSILLRE